MKLFGLLREHRAMGAVLGIGVFAFLFKTGAGLHYSLLSPLGEQVFPVWAVGLLIGGASLIQLALDVPAGFLLDRLGYVRLLKVCTFVFLLAAATVAAGMTTAIFLLTVLLSTVGWLFFSPGVAAYTLSAAPRRIAGHAIGLVDAFQSAGIVLAAVALPLVIHGTPALMAAVMAAFLAAAFLFLWAVPRDAGSVHAERKIARHPYYIRRHFFHRVIQVLRRLNPASTMLVIQNFAAAAFYGMIWFAVPLALAEGVAGNLPGFSLSIFDLTVVILGAFLGKLADTRSKRTLVLAGLLTFSVSGLLLGFQLNWWFLLLGFIATAGDELSAVSLWAWLDHLDKTHAEDGLVAGAIALFEDLGWAVGPMLAGFLYAPFGPGLVVTTGALFLFAAWFAALIVLRHPSARHVGAPAPFAVPHRHRHKR